jgi:hypothetical protein
VNQDTRSLVRCFDAKNRARRRCCVHLELTTARLLDLSVTSPGRGWGIDQPAVSDPDRGRTGLRRVRCPIVRASDGPSQRLARRVDWRWRGPLREASRVAEVGATPDDVRAWFRALGSLSQNARDEQAEQDLLHRRFPACVVVSLPGIGALDYVHDDYRTGVWQQVGVTPCQGDQASGGRMFRNGLDRFRFTRFCSAGITRTSLIARSVRDAAVSNGVG